MIGRLADCLNVVVARRAAAEYRIVVHFSEREPRRGRVAVVAKRVAQHMVRGFCSSDDASAGRVAGIALSRCALEDRPDVTVSAVDAQVRAVEYEPGREMIEVR